MRIAMKAAHIPGVLNDVPDALSRLEISGDYQIKARVLWRCLQQMNYYPEIDLFANTTNIDLERYCSLKVRRSENKREEGVHIGNALHIRWTGMKLLMLPPIPLINRTLEKFVMEGVIIVPDWKG
jgi:hypothetical protein